MNHLGQLIYWRASKFYVDKNIVAESFFLPFLALMSLLCNFVKYVKSL